MAFARHVSDGPKQGAIEGLIYPVRTRGSSLEHAMDMDTLYIYYILYIIHMLIYSYMGSYYLEPCLSRNSLGRGLKKIISCVVLHRKVWKWSPDILNSWCAMICTPED